MSAAVSSGKSLQSEAWKQLRANRVAMFSGGLILFVCLVAALSPVLSPYPFDEQFLDRVLASPSLQHWLGTDSLGRDMLSRLIYGARVSMTVGIVTALISLVIGTLYGAVAGWFGGWVDSLSMRVVDILDSIPSLVLLILVKLVFDALDVIDNPELKSLTGMLVALSLTSWVSLARVVRGQVLQVKQMAYVEAARSMGASGTRMVLQHILPNIVGPMIVLLTFQIPSNILSESFLSFLGLGLQPPYSSWGVLANDGWRSMTSFPHLMISPGVAIFVAMLAFNLLGDGLRDAFDPQMRGRV
ncbi:MAG TPA: ABC transporter permease [Bdellovibrionales bacterium]|nr:ABC transporter permease [Bdellovibrionales bacterium]